MTRLLVGVLCKEKEINNKKYYVIEKNNFKYLNNCDLIAIIPFNNKINTNILKMCDAIIIPGGDTINKYHYDIVQFCLENKIALLGICLGHQVIGLYSNSQDDKDLIKVNNHFNRNHKIDIKKNSFLDNIIKNNIVNSRHNYALEKVTFPFEVIATCNNVIEAIEYILDDNIILGVQFHPEDMKNMECFFNKFFELIISKKNVNY